MLDKTRGPAARSAAAPGLPRRGTLAAAVGAVAGMLAGFFLHQLGLGGVLGDVSLQTIIVMAAALGALLAFLGRVNVVLVAAAVLFGIFVLIADTPIMRPAAEAWVRADSVPPRADAIVVLSSSVNSAGMLNAQSVGRLLSGLELFQRGVAPALVTTEISTRFGSVTRTSTADRERLVTLGGARQGWTFVTDVHTTRDEATQVRARVGAGKSLVVVTAPLHTRRACATFEGVGFRVACVPSRELEYDAWHPRTSADRLDSFRQYVYERLGMVKYRARGWIR
jgi:uncharacterized SAM-binding protein YcdF (DUF218 family)